MTMQQIDQLREELGQAKVRARDPSCWPRIHGDQARIQVWEDVKKAEDKVLEALNEWWAQGCH